MSSGERYPPPGAALVRVPERRSTTHTCPARGPSSAPFKVPAPMGTPKVCSTDCTKDCGLGALAGAEDCAGVTACDRDAPTHTTADKLTRINANVLPIPALLTSPIAGADRPGK